MATIQQEKSSEPLLLDSGNLLFTTPLRLGRDNSVSMIKAYGIARAYMQMGYDAVAVSASDLTGGKDFFNSTLDEGFPWISANTFDPKGELAFAPYLLKKTGQNTIAILGITGKGKDQLADYTVGDWLTALQDYVEELKDRSDLILLLSNLPLHTNEEIAETFPEIAIVFTADKKRGNVSPYIVNKSLVTQSSSRGRYFGQLDFNWVIGGQWRTTKALSVDDLTRKIAHLDERIVRLKSATERAEATLNAQLKRQLDSLHRQQASALKKLEQARLAQEKESDTLFNTFSYKSRKVVPSKAAEKIESIVGEIRKNINNHNKALRHKSLSDHDRQLLQLDKIQGYTGCTECHGRQTTFWKSTGHSHAYQTLENKGQSFNTDCLPCHVTTGQVTPQSHESEKILLLTLAPDRQLIGCETCHGPALTHSKSPESVLPKRSPDQAVCLSCHTVEMDDNFSYHEQLSIVSCPSE